MSPGKRLTLEQKKCVSAHYLNEKEWMLKEETEFYLKIIHKITGYVKIIDKFRRYDERAKCRSENDRFHSKYES